MDKKELTQYVQKLYCINDADHKLSVCHWSVFLTMFGKRDFDINISKIYVLNHSSN